MPRLELHGYPAVTGVWTEINSPWEGRFMETLEPGVFQRTLREDRDQIRLLMSHGQDPQLGDKPIGQIMMLEEDSVGLRLRAELFPGLPELLVAGLTANPSQYGASFRFRVLDDDFDEMVKKSDHNPLGLPERRIRDVRVAEVGPTTFGAYKQASAYAKADAESVAPRSQPQAPGERTYTLAEIRQGVQLRAELDERKRVLAKFEKDEREAFDRKLADFRTTRPSWWIEPVSDDSDSWRL